MEELFNYYLIIVIVLFATGLGDAFIRATSHTPMSDQLRYKLLRALLWPVHVSVFVASFFMTLLGQSKFIHSSTEASSHRHKYIKAYAYLEALEEEDGHQSQAYINSQIINAAAYESQKSPTGRIEDLLPQYGCNTLEEVLEKAEEYGWEDASAQSQLVSVVHNINLPKYTYKECLAVIQDAYGVLIASCLRRAEASNTSPKEKLNWEVLATDLTKFQQIINQNEKNRVLVIVTIHETIALTDYIINEGDTSSRGAWSSDFKDKLRAYNIKVIIPNLYAGVVRINELRRKKITSEEQEEALRYINTH